jgi:hypothetical protein
LSIKLISRGKGKPAVAYRAAEKITSDYDGKISDYSRKGGVVNTEILFARPRAEGASRPRRFMERRGESREERQCAACRQDRP